jgi:hypothetical protein
MLTVTVSVAGRQGRKGGEGKEIERAPTAARHGNSVC